MLIKSSTRQVSMMDLPAVPKPSLSLGAPKVAPLAKQPESEEDSDDGGEDDGLWGDIMGGK